MILCLCQGISDHSVRATIRGGACTLDEVVAACRAGADCGACQEAVLDLLAEASRRHGAMPAHAEVGL
ncbi:MAG TPA: (2Fe-2S)-binding protein [Candidatus Acidoferrum sp.]|nr:(2Fe-2S)-binding protein [Candidatus Acidoferrum sp.]